MRALLITVHCSNRANRVPLLLLLGWRGGEYFSKVFIVNYKGAPSLYELN